MMIERKSPLKYCRDRYKAVVMLDNVVIYLHHIIHPSPRFCDLRWQHDLGLRCPVSHVTTPAVDGTPMAIYWICAYWSYEP
jgi:hypothetical protein